MQKKSWIWLCICKILFLSYISYRIYVFSVYIYLSFVFYSVQWKYYILHNHNRNFIILHHGSDLSFRFWKIQTHFSWNDQKRVRVSLLWKKNDHDIDTLSYASVCLEFLSSHFLIPSIPWALTSGLLLHFICSPIDFHYLCELVILWKQPTTYYKVKQEE